MVVDPCSPLELILFFLLPCINVRALVPTVYPSTKSIDLILGKSELKSSTLKLILQFDRNWMARSPNEWLPNWLPSYQISTVLGLLLEPRIADQGHQSNGTDL